MVLIDELFEFVWIVVFVGRTGHDHNRPAWCLFDEIKHWNNADLNNRDLQNIAEREADKLNEKARRLAGKLRKSCAFDVGFVEGKLLITKGENEKFKAGNIRKCIRGIAVFGLTEWKDLLEASRSPILNDIQVASICRVLQPNVNISPNDRLRMFQDFFDLEPVVGISDPFHQAYRGRRKPGRDRVILHVYDLSATKEKNALDIARREFETLQRLQKSPWLPSLMDSFQEATAYPHEMYFFSYIDTEAASLAERAKDHAWPIPQRIHTARRCVEALLDLHKRQLTDTDTPVLHRNLNPHSIRIRSNGEPLLTQLHFAKLPGMVTIAGAVSGGFAGLESFVAPEVLTSGIVASTIESDVYALCASLREVFEDVPNDPQADKALQILDAGLAQNPSERCNLEILLSQLESLPKQIDEPKQIAVQFWDEDTVVTFHDRHYRIITKLGAGSVGI